MTITRITRRFVLILFAALFAFVCLGGCAQKKEMDGHVDAAIKALQSGNRAELDPLLTTAAKDELNDATFGAVSGAILKLGSFNERTMSRISVSGNRMVGQYTLDFANGSVSLSMVVIDGRIQTYAFGGSDFDNALAKVVEEHNERNQRGR